MANLAPPPGYALLGLGGTFNVRDQPVNQFIGARTRNQGASWLDASGLMYAGSSPRELYAAPIDSPVIAANRTIVEQLNPEIIFPWHDTMIHTPHPPLPQGFILLGQGGTFNVPGGRVHGVRMTRRNGAEWLEYEGGSYQGNSPNQYYAVRPDHPICEANRDLVMAFNPDVNFPWMMPPAPAPAPAPAWTLGPIGAIESLPVNLPPLPPGHVLLGRGTTFTAPPSDFQSHRWHIDDGNIWHRGLWGGNGMNSWYCVELGSEVAAMNMGIVDRLNPGAPVPWRANPLPQPDQMGPVVTELPLPYPEPPDGAVVLGLGRTFTVPDNWFEGWYFRTTHPQHGWQFGASFNGSVTTAWYAAAQNSEIVRMNPLPPPMDTPQPPAPPAVNPFDMPADPVAFRPWNAESQRNTYGDPRAWSGRAMEPGNLPDRCILLGWLDQLEVREGDAYRATYGTFHDWITFRTIQQPRANHFVAARPDSAIALRNPAAVAHWNPDRRQAAPGEPSVTRSFRKIDPSDHPTPLPRGFCYIGHGNEITVVGGPIIFSTPYGGSWRNDRLVGSPTVPRDTVIAAAFDSEMVKLNRHSVEFHNPGCTWDGDRVVLPPFPPLGIVLPPIPQGYEDYLVLGIANQIPATGQRRVALYYNRRQWSHSSDCNIGNGHEIQACPASSLEVQQNMERAAFYNPVRFLELFPPPVVPRYSDGSPRLFNLSFNGIPMASREEWENTASPLVINTANFPEVTNAIWEALFWPAPEDFIDTWAEREPVILAGVDFHLIPVVADVVEVVAVAESERSISDVITRAAAGVLLRGGLNDHFQFLENGELVVNPQSPPTLEQGYEIIRRTLEMRETGNKIENFSAWMLGMLGDQLENLYGDAFDVSMVLAQTNRALNTYQLAVGVFRSCWATRRQNLSYTHHREAFYSKITADQREFVLDTASELGLTVAEQRKLTSYVRIYGEESLVEDMPADAQELLERVETRSVNKHYMFFLRADNRWYRYRGPFEHIPNGADPILNADTRAILNRDGTPQGLDEWVPPGVVVPSLRGHAATNARNREAALAGDEPVRRSRGGNTQRAQPADGTFGFGPEPEAIPTPPIMVDPVPEGMLDPSTAGELHTGEIRGMGYRVLGETDNLPTLEGGPWTNVPIDAATGQAVWDTHQEAEWNPDAAPIPQQAQEAFDVVQRQQIADHRERLLQALDQASPWTADDLGTIVHTGGAVAPVQRPERAIPEALARAIADDREL